MLHPAQMIQLNRQPRRLPKNKTKQKKRYAGCLAHAVIWRVLPRHCQPTPTQPKYIPDVKYIRAFYSVVSNRRHLNLYYYSIQYAVYSMQYVPMCLDICTLFSDPRGCFLALSAAGHAGGPPVHHGASLGPVRAPWRVLWAFKVTESGT